MPETDPEPTTDPAGDPPASDPPETFTAEDKAALEAAIKKEREATRVAARAGKAAVKELEELKAAGMSDQEKAVKDAVDAATAETAAKFTGQLVKSALVAAATGKLTDPTDAVAFIDAAQFELVDGAIDDKAVTVAVDKLIAEKPHLAGDKKPPPLPGNGQPPAAPKGNDMDDWIRQTAGIRT